MRKGGKSGDSLAIFNELLKTENSYRVKLGIMRALAVEGVLAPRKQVNEWLKQEKTADNFALASLVAENSMKRLALARQGLAIDPKHGRAALSEARALFFLGRFVESDRLTKRYAKMHPDEFGFSWIRVFCNKALGKLDSLCAEFRGNYKKNRTSANAKALVAALAQANRLKELEQVVEGLDPKLKSEPSFRDVRVRIDLFKGGDVEKHLAVIEELLKIDPYNTKHLSIKALVLSMKGDENALKTMQLSSQLEPFDIGKCLLTAEFAISKGNHRVYESRVKFLDQLVPNYHELVLLKGRVASNHRDFKKAVELCDQILKIHSRHRGAISLKVHCLRKLGRNKEADKLALKLGEVNEGGIPQDNKQQKSAEEKLKNEYADFMIAINALISKGKYEDAEKAYIKGLGKYGEERDLEIKLRLAESCLDRNFDEGALKWLGIVRRTLAWSGGSSKVYQRLSMLQAEIHCTQGDYQAALSIYRRLDTFKSRHYSWSLELPDVIRAMEQKPAKGSVGLKVDLKKAPRSYYSRSCMVLSLWKVYQSLGFDCDFYKLSERLRPDKNIGTKPLTALKEVNSQADGLEGYFFKINEKTLKRLLGNKLAVILFSRVASEEGVFVGHANVINGYDPVRDVFLVNDNTLSTGRRWITPRFVNGSVGFVVLPKGKVKDFKGEFKHHKELQEFFKIVDDEEEDNSVVLKQLQKLELIDDIYMYNIAIAEILEASGRAKEAIQYFCKAHECQSFIPNPAIWIARTYIEKQQYQEAIKWLRKADERCTGNVHVGVLKAKCQNKGVKLRDREAVLRTLFKHKPNQIEVLVAVWLHKYNEGDFRAALRLCKKSIHQVTKFNDLLKAVTLAEITCDLQLYTLCMEKISNMQLTAAQSKVAAKIHDEAAFKKHVKNFSEKQPYKYWTRREYMGSVAYAKAEESFKSGRFEEVDQQRRRAYSLHPNHPAHSSMAGKTYFETGNYRRAASIFEAALKQSLKSDLGGGHLAWFQLMAAETYIRMGRMADAEKVYKQASGKYFTQDIDWESLKSLRRQGSEEVLVVKFPRGCGINDKLQWAIDLVSQGNKLPEIGRDWSKNLSLLRGLKGVHANLSRLNCEELKALLGAGRPVFVFDELAMTMDPVYAYDPGRRHFLRQVQGFTIPLLSERSAERKHYLYFTAASDRFSFVPIHQRKYKILPKLLTLLNPMTKVENLTVETSEIIKACEGNKLYEDEVRTLKIKLLVMSQKPQLLMKLLDGRDDNEALWMRAQALAAGGRLKESEQLCVKVLENQPFNRAVQLMRLKLLYKIDPGGQKVWRLTQQIIDCNGLNPRIYMEMFLAQVKASMNKEAEITASKVYSLLDDPQVLLSVARALKRCGAEDFSNHLLKEIKKKG